MKVFSFKRLIGLAAIGGAIAYARKHGGVKNAVSDLKKKANDFLNENKSASTTTNQDSSSYQKSSSNLVDDTGQTYGGTYGSGGTGYTR